MIKLNWKNDFYFIIFQKLMCKLRSEFVRKLHISLFIIHYLYTMFLSTILNNNIIFGVREHGMFMCLQLQSFEQFKSPNL